MDIYLRNRNRKQREVKGIFMIEDNSGKEVEAINFTYQFLQL